MQGNSNNNMNNGNFENMSSNLSKNFNSHSTSRNSNIQKIMQIKSDFEKEIRAANSHCRELLDIFNDNKNTLSEIQKKIDDRNRMLAVAEQSRRIQQNTHENASVVLKTKIEVLQKQKSELVSQNSEIEIQTSPTK